MTATYHESDGVTLYKANALDLPLADSSVDLVVTSPPYFGLRSYKDGGDHYDGQIGAEATPTEFVDSLIAATREMIRVTKPTGSIWVNLGDKYVNKALTGIPWRYALRCVDDLGLTLRAEVVWSKPNGLPESVKDRVRRSHETWFHFTLGSRYYSAVDEIREPHVTADRKGERRSYPPGSASSMSADGEHQSMTGPFAGLPLNPLGKLPGSVWTIPAEPLRVPEELGVKHFAAFPTEWPRRIIQGWSPEGGTVLDPFSGTGTTALVASVLGRHGIGVDMSEDYCRLAAWRTTDPKQRDKAARQKYKAPKKQARDA